MRLYTYCRGLSGRQDGDIVKVEIAASCEYEAEARLWNLYRLMPSFFDPSTSMYTNENDGLVSISQVKISVEETYRRVKGINENVK